MNEGLIPNRYAKALYEFANESGNSATVYDQMRQLVESFSAVETLQGAVENPYMPEAEKENILLTASGATKGDTFDKFILLLIKNNRVSYTRSIALAYQKIYRKSNSIVQVLITTACELSKTELEKIENIVKVHAKDMTWDFIVKIDPELIGGFTIKIDSMLMDASIKNELKKLRLKLLS